LLVRPQVEYVPHLPVAQRAALTSLTDRVRLVDLRYGFDDEPDVPKALCKAKYIEPNNPIHYYIVDDRAAASEVKGMAGWRKWLFMMMSAACVPAGEYFHLPADRTTEIQIVGGRKRRIGPLTYDANGRQVVPPAST
jgi:KUP system potassium uptake protein